VLESNNIGVFALFVGSKLNMWNLKIYSLSNIIEECILSVFIVCCVYLYNATRNNWWVLDCFLFIIQSTHHFPSVVVKNLHFYNIVW